jgi:hypothetical protein
MPLGQHWRASSRGRVNGSKSRFIRPDVVEKHELTAWLEDPMDLHENARRIIDRAALTMIAEALAGLRVTPELERERPSGAHGRRRPPSDPLAFQGGSDAGETVEASYRGASGSRRRFAERRARSRAIRHRAVARAGGCLVPEAALCSMSARLSLVCLRPA